MSYTIVLPNGTKIRDIPDDIPRETAKAMIAERVPELEKYLRKSTGKDLGKDLAAGAYDVGKIVTGDIPELMGLGKNRVGEWFAKQGKATRDEKSAYSQLDDRRIQAALAEAEKEGLGSEVMEAIKQYGTNPRAVGSFLATNAPQIILSLLTGGGASLASKGLQLGAKAAGRVAVGTAVGTGAAMQGADVGSDVLEEARALWQQNPGLFRALPEFRALVAGGKSEAEAADAVALSKARMAGGVAGGLSALLGATPIGGALERAVLGKSLGKGVLKGAGATALKEAPTEFVEEFGGKVGGNLALQGVDPERGTYEGAGVAGIQGLIGGAGMGGIAGAYGGYRGDRDKTREALELKRVEAERVKNLAKIRQEQGVYGPTQDVEDLEVPKIKLRPLEGGAVYGPLNAEDDVSPPYPNRVDPLAGKIYGPAVDMPEAETPTLTALGKDNRVYGPMQRAYPSDEAAPPPRADPLANKVYGPTLDVEDMPISATPLGAKAKKRPIKYPGIYGPMEPFEIAPMQGPPAPNIVPSTPAEQVATPAAVPEPTPQTVPETPAGVAQPPSTVIAVRDLKAAGLSGNTNTQRTLRDLLLGKDPNVTEDQESIKNALYAAYVATESSRTGVPKYLTNLMEKFGYDPNTDPDRQRMQENIEAPAPVDAQPPTDVPRETPVEPAPVPVAEEPQAPAAVPSAPVDASVVAPPAPFKKSRARKAVDPAIQAARDFYDENKPDDAPLYVDLHPKAKATFDAYSDPETPGYKGLSQVEVDEIAGEHNKYAGQDPDAHVLNKDAAPVPADEATIVEQGIEGKEAVDVARWLAENAPSEDYRLIASKVAKKIADMERAGVVFSFTVVHNAADGPPILNKSRGAVRYSSGSTDPNNPQLATIDVYINGADRTGKVGTSYKTVLHELIHAALIPPTRLGTRVVGKNSTAAQPTRRLLDVLAAITSEIDAKAEATKAGKYKPTAFERLLTARDINAINTVDELIAWSLTDRNMQKWLGSIQYTPKQSLWRALFDAIRGFFGVPAQSGTALEEVLTATEELFNVSAQEMASAANEMGWAMDQSVAADPVPEENKPPITMEELINRETPTPANGIKQVATSFLDSILGHKVKLKKADGTTVEAKMPSPLEVGFADRRARLRVKFDALGVPFMGDSGKVSGIVLADYADATIPQLAQGVLEHGPLTFNEAGIPSVPTDNKGPNYIQVIDRLSEAAKAADIPITRAVGMLNAALKGKRAAAVMSNDKEANARVRNLGVPVEEQMLGDQIWVENPWIAEVYGIMRAHLNGQIDAMVAAGKIPQSKAQEWKDATYYVPFYRVFNDSMFDETNTSVGALNSPMEVVKKLVGGKEPIQDVLSGMMDQSMYMTAAAIKSNATRALAIQGAELGLATWTKKPSISPTGTRNYDAKFFDEDGNERGVRFTDREDALALGGMTEEFGPLLKMFQKTSALLRSGIVRMPDFAARDIARNASQAWFFSGSNAGLVKTTFRVANNAAKNWGQHLKRVAGKDVAYTDTQLGLMERGLAGHGLDLIGDIHELDTVRSRFGMTVGTSTKLMRKMMDAIYIDTDMASKTTLVDQLMSQGVSKEEAIYRAYGMAPFAQRGRWPIVRTMAAMAPFIQANIKGLHVLSLMLRGNAQTIPVEQRKAVKHQFLMRGAMLAVATAIYTMLMDDDELYEGQAPSSRDMNYIIPVGDTGWGFRMPVAPEAALLFKIGVERMTRMMLGHEDAWRGVGSSLADNYIPMWGIMPGEGGPQLIKPWIELAAGKSLHTNAPIVRQDLQKLEPAMQYTPDTTSIAKWIGSVMSNVPGAPEWTQSPVKLEYMVKGILGNAALFGLQQASSIYDKAWGDNTVPDRPWARSAGFSSMFATDTAGNPQAMFYEIKQEADRVAATWKAISAQDKERANEYFDEHQALIDAKEILDKLNTEMAAIRKAQKQMLADPDIDSDTKSQQRDEMTRAINVKAAEAKSLWGLLE